MTSTHPIYVISAIILILMSCGSQKTSLEPKLPERSQPSPTYDTDEVLEERIQRLEQKLEKSPGDEHLQLQLAALHQDLGQIDEALAYMESLSESGYQKFRIELPDSTDVAMKVDDKIAQQKFIIEQLANSDDINLRPFPAPINTPNSEYLPQFTIDESKMIFTRRIHGQEDLVEGVWDGDKYVTTAISELNGPLNEGAHTISSDGNYMVYTFCDPKAGYGSCDLFRTRRMDDGTWSKPANLGAKINSQSWDSQPSLSADGKFLFFVSRRKGGSMQMERHYTSNPMADSTWEDQIFSRLP